MSKGYCAIGIYGVKTPENLGTLWRSANLYGASLIFTVGKRYKDQSSDTMKTNRDIPLIHFETLEEMRSAKDPRIPLVAIELDERAILLPEFTHPISCWYLLGAEDAGLPKKALEYANQIIEIPTVLPYSMNVSVAGSIVLYDRFVRGKK